MTKEQEILWEKIRTFELDNPTAALTFTGRLAKENGWSLEYTVRAVMEYKKFMFLLCIAGHPVTPSDQVDQVWHLHLLYTQSYWIDFCQQVIGRQIHHGPTRGGEKENARFTDWYEKTTQLYQETFGDLPPADIWQPTRIRFAEVNFRRVNLDRNWIIKKPSVFI